MKNKIFEIIIIVLLVVVLSLQVVTMVKVFSAPAGEADENESSQGQNEIDLNVVNFDTPYCNVQFPATWIDYLKFEEKTEGSVYSATFICEINGKQAELFTVTFGAEDAENSIGTIRSGGKDIPVAIKTAKIDKSAWTKEEYKIITDMQDGKAKVKESILSHKEIV